MPVNQKKAVKLLVKNKEAVKLLAKYARRETLKPREAQILEKVFKESPKNEYWANIFRGAEDIKKKEAKNPAIREQRWREFEELLDQQGIGEKPVQKRSWLSKFLTFMASLIIRT